MRVDYHCLPEQDGVWLDINALALTCGRSGGVFRIHAHKPGAALRWHPCNMMPIARAAGEDPHGVLYIGAARDFRDDFITAWASLGSRQADVSHHEVGLAFRRADALRQRFRLLGCTLHFSEVPFDAAEAERAAYEAEFGELPPLHQVGAPQREALAAIA
jgi:hypothetical protein